MSFLDLPEEFLEKIFLQFSTHGVQQNLAKVCKLFLGVSRLPDMVRDYTLTIDNLGDDEEAACSASFESPEICMVETYILR